MGASREELVSPHKTMRNVFAWVASMIMIVVVFQVCVGPACTSVAAATGPEPDLQEIQQAPDTGTNQFLSPAVNYIESPGGSVEGLSIPPKFEVSSPGASCPTVQLTAQDGMIEWWTSHGVYSVDPESPTSVDLKDYARNKVANSLFTLDLQGALQNVDNGQIIEATEATLHTSYEVISPDRAVRGSMELIIDFTSDRPKVTASFTPAAGEHDWRVAWLVVPSKDTKFVGGKDHLTLPLANYANINLPGLAANLSVPISKEKSQWRQVNADWRDAKVGSMKIMKIKNASGDPLDCLAVLFPVGSAVIDPTLVIDGLSSVPTAAFQRHVFTYGGYYWLFYPLGPLSYKRSSDGVTWDAGTVLPGSTSMYQAGFDVAQRDGKVAVTWIDDLTTGNIYFQKGRILSNKIVWDSRVTVASITPEYYDPPSSTIGADGAYWIVAHTSNSGVSPYTATSTVYRSLDGSFSTSTTQKWTFQSIDGWARVCNAIVPMGNGNVAMMETDWDEHHTSTKAAWHYFDASSSTWAPSLATTHNTGVFDADIGIQQNAKTDKFSVTSGPGGALYVAFLNNVGSPSNGYGIELTRLRTDGSEAAVGSVGSLTAFNPSICIDRNQIIHILYSEGLLTVKHVLSWDPAEDSWPIYLSSPMDLGGLGGVVLSLNCDPSPTQSLAISWTNYQDELVFASTPLPFGTQGAATEPWSRDGLSPYGTYFSVGGDYISPGSGALNLQMTDASIPARGGLDLGISRLYVQPRYFLASTGEPLGTYRAHDAFPFCNLGQGWSLDLPYMDEVYVWLPGGQRYVIQWGNNGNASEFENHDGIDFVLRAIQSEDYYELVLASGMRYQFQYWMNDHNLLSISDGHGADPWGYPSATGSMLNVSYQNKATRIKYIVDPWNRYINFTFYLTGDFIGYLYSITDPNGSRTTFNYTLGSDYRVLLNNVTDPLNRVTSFTYNSSADYCLSTMTYPTGGKVEYTYAIDPSVGVDIRSWLVTKAVLKDPSNAIIRQTALDYKTVNGKVRFAKVTEKNETGAIQGYTEHIYQSSGGKYEAEIKKDAGGIQFLRTVTYYDSNNNPARVDTYKGASTTVSYSDCSSTDDWGNTIFSRNALGYESYSSYANTSAVNSFRGQGKAVSTGSGKILYDSFDDWDYSDWTWNVGDILTMDGSADPEHTPALKIESTSGHSSLAQRTIGPLSIDMIVSARVYAYTPLNQRNYIEVIGASSSRLDLCIYNQSNVLKFQYLSGGTWYDIQNCAQNTWYDVAVAIMYSANQYDIYIDGTRVLTNRALQGSGSIYHVRFNPGLSCSIYVDNVRVYKSQTVSIGLPAGLSAELYDNQDRLLDRGSNGTLYLSHSPATLELNAPPSYIRVFKSGDPRLDTFVMDVWGGDSYTFTSGAFSSPISKNTVGLGRYVGLIADDAWPTGGTTYSFSPPGAIGTEGQWVTEAGDSLTGSKYHASSYTNSTHYHGYSGATTTLAVDYDDILGQYVWLSDGKIPVEIMVQYYFGGAWHRAYWGGDSMDGDMIVLASGHSALSPTTKVRIGDVPTTTNKWLQLSAGVADLGLATGSSTISGVIYGLVGGTARWDSTTRMNRSVSLSGVPTGYEAELELTSDVSWRESKGGSGGYTYWLQATKNKDPDYDFESPAAYVRFDDGPSSYDSGGAMLWAESSLTQIANISLTIYAPTYSHDGYNSQEYMHSGITMRLYDSSGNNYASYTYWLACWSGNTDNATPTDQYTKVIWGRPVGTVTAVMHPSTDWTINWASCAHVKYEVFVVTSYARSDHFLAFYKDLEIKDSGGNIEKSTFQDTRLTLSRVSSGPGTQVVFDPYAAGFNVFPAEGKFKIFNSGRLVFEGPTYQEVYMMDEYTYSTPKFYPNEVRPGIHSLQVGSLTYQDVAKTVPMESYSKYNQNGDEIETRLGSGSNWVYSQAGYDQYGHRLWSSDPSGRLTFTEYSSVDLYTSPSASGLGGSAWDAFEADTMWTPTKSGSGGYTYWLTAQYTTARSYSPTHSIETSFVSGPPSYDTGVVTVSKDYLAKPIKDIAPRMYCEVYSHDSTSGNTMDAGIRVRLYDSSGLNYANYTYWLACWRGNTDNKTTTDPYVKVIYGKPQMGVWLRPVLHLSSDWTINWASCAKVTMELYFYCSWAYGDSLKLFYDDVSVNYVDDQTTYELIDYTYFRLNGSLATATDALDRVTSYRHDKLGRKVKETHPDNAYTTWTYNDQLNTVETKDYTSTGTLVQKTLSKYDCIGRLVNTTRYGTGASPYSWQTNSYNWADQVMSQKDARGHVTTTLYDYLGRVTRVTYPDSNYSTTAYDDANNMGTICSYNVSSAQMTHKTVKIYDNLGRLNATREYTTSTAYNETQMTYDASNNLLTVKTPRTAYSQVTRMTYDSLNRLNTTTFYDGLTETAWYDESGRTIGTKDRELNVTRTTYDAAGRVYTVASPAETVTNTYDAAGQKTLVQSSLGSITYGYNLRGWMNSLVEVIGTNTYTFGFGYDSVGNRLWARYPDANNITYTYDAYDRVRTVMKGTTTLETLYYNKDDSIYCEVNGATLNTTYGYNSRDWTTSIVSKKGAQTKVSLAYTYDDVGNVKRIVNSVTSKTESYAYDWLDRMTFARGPWGASDAYVLILFTYDQVGNRLTKVEGATTTTYAYGQNDQITGDGTWTYTLDPNGNTAWKTKSNEKWNYQFNAQDQLTRVVKWTYSGGSWSSSTIADYSYDGEGARAKTVAGATTTEFVYESHNPLIEKTGTTYTDYIYVSGEAMAKIVGTTNYYYISDALGSTRQVWGGGSQPTYSVKTYKPFGTPYGITGTERVLFAGEILESTVAPTTGLYYIYLRWMDPEYGRFISLDSEMGSTDNPQTLNRYVYCQNNPLRFTDPLGNLFGIKLPKISLKTVLKVVVIVATVAACVATAGLASPILAVAASAAIGALSSAADTAISGGSLTDIAKSALIGGAFGAVTGGVGQVWKEAGKGALMAYKYGGKGGMGIWKTAGKIVTTPEKSTKGVGFLKLFKPGERPLKLLLNKGPNTKWGVWGERMKNVIKGDNWLNPKSWVHDLRFVAKKEWSDQFKQVIAEDLVLRGLQGAYRLGWGRG